MKVKNPDAPVTNKVFWQGINAIVDLFEKSEKRNEERHLENEKSHQKLENRIGTVEVKVDKLDRKIDNLAANTPTIQRVEKIEKDIKKLQVN